MCKLLVVFGLIWFFSNTEGKSFGGRIVNGTDAKLGEFPYIVSLRWSDGDHKCGGTILNENWILTAAHCIEARETIQHGVVEISPNASNTIPRTIAIVHENYNPRTLENDIAVVRLNQSLKFDNYTQPIVLPPQDYVVPESSPAVLAGWGYNSTEGPTVNFLQKANLTTSNFFRCGAIHIDNNNTVFQTNICAGAPGGWKGQCSGDSGGPLIVNGVQVGIVSWSIKPCAVPPFPGVYARVASYVNWIKSKIN